MSFAATQTMHGTSPPSLLRRGRLGIASRFTLVAIFSILAIDGFPAGIALLREFGARPINFVLAAAAGAFLLSSVFRLRAIPLRRGTILAATALILGVTVINLAIAVDRSGPDVATIISSWGRQFLMFAWGIASFFTWKRMLRSVEAEEYSALMCVAALIPILAFFLEFAGGDSIAAILEPLRTKAEADPRPSGFSTEPSTYTAWAAVVWPLAVFSARNARSTIGRAAVGLVLVVLAVSTYLSGARTGIVIFMLQGGYFGYWWLRRQRAFGNRLGVLIAVLILAAVASLLLWERLISLTNLQEGGSNIARFAYTVAGIQLFLSHPWLGTGIGQFSYFFPVYVPDFALNSPEVSNYTYGVSVFRASTFNLFVRLLCEFGLPLGAILGWLVIRPIVVAVRSRFSEPFLVFAALSAVGGVGFWLSQDQYGYQPAILSLAVLSLALAKASRNCRITG
jgi:hypothetical protein